MLLKKGSYMSFERMAANSWNTMLDQAENLKEGLSRLFQNLYQIVLNID